MAALGMEPTLVMGRFSKGSRSPIGIKSGFRALRFVTVIPRKGFTAALETPGSKLWFSVISPRCA